MACFIIMVANLEFWGILLRTPLELRGIILITYLENLNQQVGVERRRLSFILRSLELSRDLRDCRELSISTGFNWKPACYLVVHWVVWLDCSPRRSLICGSERWQVLGWNPVGIETFNCFKKVCIIERNTTENSRSEPVPKEVQIVLE